MTLKSYAGDRLALWNGDCLALLRDMPDDSVDSIVTDPPYGLGFMGKAWDALPPGAVWAAECLRVLKPGGHMLAFGGSRTWHRLAVAVEDGGFEIRDSIAWLYGSGFPKSLDVGKALDKLDASDERRQRALEFTAWMRSTGITAAEVNEATGTNMGGHFLTAAAQPSVATAELFDLMRPLLPEVPERIQELVRQRTVESKNFAAREVTGSRTLHDTSRVRLGFTGPNYGGGAHYREVDTTAPATPEAQQWEGWGTALKPAFEPIVVGRKPLVGTVAANVLVHGTGALNIDGCRVGEDVLTYGGNEASRTGSQSIGAFSGVRPDRKVTGRWPANVVLDEEQAAVLDAQSGISKDGVAVNRRRDPGATKGTIGIGRQKVGSTADVGYGGSGGASRFFYVAKAPKSERVEVNGLAHPTVKPLTLMRWLCRLVTPPGGLVLDPFAGSGTTGEAALLEGFRVLLADDPELDDDYTPLIEARVARFLATQE